TECGLTSLEGLAGCTGLKRLHVSGNSLRSLNEPGISELTGLEVLWANDNKINSIAGLERLTSLTTLWLANNRLGLVGDNLRNQSNSLQELNLAGNKLGTFKSIQKLVSLRKLSSLLLNDPHFGDNPVCHLSNYKTYLGYHLPQLKMLDAEVINSDERELACAIFAKKCMYYNMRQKTAKR
ncbi:unnamed protein product, partial [Chrysoparadoxa australica]